ncbi:MULTISPECIES: DUF2487 family protein [Thermoactinomyces]|jgi:hypothetical protein|uniref:DUF2487 family protein n=1 Tax=Thermoactinomyces TaxID=2023 RepID=UPI0018DBECAA|nr:MULTISPECIES: DUF2487 family protein [Thermoactinomyces]MBH8584879.1 DUF2487 family protein [Thermoactinomyces sp. CICC 10520]MBI0391089.1 DUF2487 family protein [Thermoactinomyces sp. CICC 24226]MCF6134351.1 YpiF family protein [Thermoactinomyces vulgaris]
MRLDQINQDGWKEVAAFVDTLCLPVASVRIKEKELDIKNGKMVQYFAEELEKTLTGRLLLLPSVSYTGQNPEVFKSYFHEIIKDIRQSGFNYFVIVYDGRLKALVEESYGENKQNLLFHAMELSPEATQSEMEEETRKLYEKVLELWQHQS